MARAEGEGIVIKHSHKVLELADGVLKAEDMLADKEVEFPVDYVILSAGIKPADHIYHELLAGSQWYIRLEMRNLNGKIVTAVQAGNKWRMQKTLF